MTRFTFVAFIALSGFFYVTGKPVDDPSSGIHDFADLPKSETTSKKMQNGKVQQPQDKGTLRKKRLKSQKTTHIEQIAALPEIPGRNPRRNDSAASSPVVTASTSPQNNQKLAFLTKAADGRNQPTAAKIIPLASRVKYTQQTGQNPILGPRLMTVLVKRELRRVGCYEGNITSDWDESARSALEHYNQQAGTSFPTNRAKLITLEKIQQSGSIVCRKAPPVGRTIIARAGTLSPKANLKKRSNRWRTKTRRKNAAYLPMPTSLGASSNVTHPDQASNRTSSNVMKRKSRKAKSGLSHHKKRIRLVAKKRKAKRRTYVRGWKRTYRRKKFGFSTSNGTIRFNN